MEIVVMQTVAVVVLLVAGVWGDFYAFRARRKVPVPVRLKRR
jgi:hypothetical protein